VDWNEDGEFSINAQREFKCGGLFDAQGLCLHCLHASNSSTCYSQFKLPIFLLTKIFPTLNLPPISDHNRTVPPILGYPQQPESTRISRNALCPCGSGKRYKYCHGKLT